MTVLDYAVKAKDRLDFEFPYDLKEWTENMNMLMENYHKHTTWSDLVQIDSATSMEEFIEYSKKMGCRNYFSGEHGYQGEWLAAYDLCIQMGIKFRYSVEAYWVKDINSVTTEEYIDKKGNKKTREKKDNMNCHMVIVARNYKAMRKLNYMISVAHQEGFYYKPRIDLNMLFELDEDDVYITSACIAGWKYEDATEIWYRVAKHFGSSFFLEYQANNTDEQKKINSIIYELSQSAGIKTIIGLDTHYISEEDRIKRDNLLKRKGIRYPEEDGWYMDFPTGTEIFERMTEQGVIPPEEIIYAMMNTHVFNEGCEELEYNTKFKIPILEKYKGKSYEERSKILFDLLNKKYNEEDFEHRTEDRKEGMLYEYSEIDGSGTADYFLDNYELIDLAVNKYGGHITTTSRGSASSYYSSKLLGFTTMDRFESEVPIYPERFVTKDRILNSHQMPDIDINCQSQEPFVLAGKELCGEHGCYPLLAVGRLKEKNGFKLYAGVNGIEPSVANEITKSIDRYNEALKNAEEEDRDLIEIEDYITDKHHLKLFNESKSYQEIIEQAKVHACGFALFNGVEGEEDVPGYGDIRYEIGLIRCHSESTGKTTIVANIEGSLLDKYGYVKDDFLIVDVVGIIHKLYAAIGREVPSVTELRKMVTEDEKTWRMYEIGATCCLNQCEKASTTKKVMKFKPKNIKELAAFIAGIRPGFKSLINGFLDRVEYTNGEPAIDELLEDCFHYMLYQEAVMKIFSWLGIEMKDSYDTIKKISKKKLKGEALQHVEDTLREHWLKNIGNLDNFEPVYKVIKDSARYSFNAPHALAMANDSLYEAWMKANHTSVFYEVTLNHYQGKGDKNKVAELTREAMTVFGYKMGTYEYGKDNTKFTVDDKEKIIYPNLSSVKSIGDKAVESMMEISQSSRKDIIDIYAAIKGTKINSSVFRKLVKINYFKQYGSIKYILQCLDIYDKWIDRKTISKADVPQLGLDKINLRRYATDVTPKGNKSAKRWMVFNVLGLIKALCSNVSKEEFPSEFIAQFQYEVLGYIDYTDESLNDGYRTVCVMNLDMKYSPKFEAYCIKNGKVSEMKIHKKKNFRDKRCKTSFQDLEVKDGDILYIKDCKKEPRRRKTDSGWEDIPDTYDWWIKDYSIIHRAAKEAA